MSPRTAAGPERHLRVALVYRNFSLDGSLERDMVLLARGLVARGAEVTCYANPRTRAVEIPGATFVDVAPLARSDARLGYALECLSFAAAATRALRRDRERFDIVHVKGISAWEHDVVTVNAVTRAMQRRWPREAGRTFRAARLRGAVAPVVRPQLSVARTIERLQLRPGRFRRLVAVTDQVKRDLVDVHGVPAALVDVVPHPVSTEVFAPLNGTGPTVRPSLGLAPETPLLLFVGSSFRRKGLSEAIAAVRDLEPRAHLVVVGGGDPEPFRREAERAGVTDRVHFVGRTAEPERFYRESDVVVLPTRSDPWGIPVVEAMAAGVPVVTTEAAGASELLRRAGAGIVLADGSPDALRAAVAGLLGDPGLRRRMALRGRSVASELGADAHAEAMLAVYERARPRGDGGR
jgi:UDP-glucose:(heptosyl)LPS alpha-1,3-glucosyltransferase